MSKITSEKESDKELIFVYVLTVNPHGKCSENAPKVIGVYTSIAIAREKYKEFKVDNDEPKFTGEISKVRINGMAIENLPIKYLI